jgi:hypothetical protein
MKRLERPGKWLRSVSRLSVGSGIVVAIWFVIVPLVLLGWLIARDSHEIPDVLRAIAAVWWPLIAAFVLLALAPELPSMLHRLRRASFGSGAIELDPQTIDVELKVEAAEQVQAATPTPPSEGELPTEGPPESELLGVADKNLALIKIAISLEQAVRALGGRSGLVRTSEMSAPRLVSALAQVQLLTSEVVEAFSAFWNARNRVIHGRAEGLTDRDVTALIDSGTRLLRVIRSAHTALVTKQEVFRVRAVVQLFSDADATAPDPLWRGVMLEPAAVLLPAEEMVTIYPTTLPVAESDLVTWKYNVEQRVGPRWYRDPTTGEIRKAWDKSASFVGAIVTPPA